MLARFGLFKFYNNYQFFLKSISVLLFMIHIALMFCFYFLEVPTLSLLNLLSFIVYAVCFLLSYKDSQAVFVFRMIVTEVLFYSLAAVYVISDAALFNIYGFALLPFSYLTKYVIDIRCITNKNAAKKPMQLIPIFLTIFMVFIIEQLLIFYHPPLVVLEDTVLLRFLTLLNLAIIAVCIIIGCGTLLSLSLEFSKQTHDNMEKMKQLMKDANSANKAKSSFLANMSHEIRTPMNAICGMSDLLEEEDLSAKAMDYVETIKTAGSHLLNIINDILDFSKIESGKLDLVEKEYHFNELIQETMNIMSIRAKDKAIRLIAEIDDGIPAVFQGDEGRIRQIIINLMNNAIKFTDVGSITLKAKFEATKEKGGLLKFTISDTGRGIKAEDIEKLFNAFEQVDKQRNSGIEGTGLGLSICKLLVNKMQGEISVESVYEKGSSFHFYIYQTICDATPCNFNSATKIEKEKKPTLTLNIKNCKALVVDDNRVNLKVAAGLLKKYGVSPVEVNCGMDAIETLKKNSDYDLIFMDHLMPNMDGIETTQHIRQLNDYGKQVPIIALTANAVSGMEQEFLNAGMNDFLTKPIETEKLTEIFTKWIPQEKIQSL